LTPSAKLNTHLTATDNDLYLMTVTTGAGIAFIFSPASILDGNPGECSATENAGCNVIAGRARVYATQNVGASGPVPANKIGLSGRLCSKRRCMAVQPRRLDHRRCERI
jgi:hypothetical protein